MDGSPGPTRGRNIPRRVPRSLGFRKLDGAGTLNVQVWYPRPDSVRRRPSKKDGLPGNFDVEDNDGTSETNTKDTEAGATTTEDPEIR